MARRDLSFAPPMSELLSSPLAPPDVSLDPSAGQGVSLDERAIVPLDSLPGIGARVYRTADQTITTATSTALVFTSERFDTGSFHDDSTNTTRLTIPANGIYLITATIRWGSDGVGVRQLSFQINGSTPISHDAIAPASGVSGTLMTSTTIYQMIAGDYVECIVRQTSGGNLAVVAAANESPEFAIARLS